MAVAAVCEVGGCGVLAVGRCGPCGRAMCTSHRAMLGREPVLDRCVECHRVGAHAHARSLRDPAIRRRHEYFVATLAAMPAGPERLVRAVHYLGGVSAGRTITTGPLRFEPVLLDHYGDLAHVCPDYWPGGATTVNLLAPPWEPLSVAAWFLPRIALTGKPPNTELKGWVATGNKLHGWRSVPGPPLAAWRLPEGSLSIAVRGTVGVDARADAYVVVDDGRVMLDYEQPCLLSARGLYGMGNLLWGPPRRPWDPA